MSMMCLNRPVVKYDSSSGMTWYGEIGDLVVQEEIFADVREGLVS